MKRCCICANPIEVEPLSGWADGHNAEPVKSGRCCSWCNDMIVIPRRRLYQIRGYANPKESYDDASHGE